MNITLEAKQKQVERNLRALKKPYITLADIYQAAELDITPHGFYYRVRDLPAEEKPDHHGAFLIGGATGFTLDHGIDWIKHHFEYWHQRQAAKALK